MEPVVKTNISQVVAERLIQHIGKGNFKPGDKLPSEKELMQMFGVGRSSMREALQALAIMDVIDIRPGQGTFVKDYHQNLIVPPNILTPLVDKDVTLDLLEAREIMEPPMAELAVNRATAEDLEKMEALLLQCEENLKNDEPVYELSAAFHLLVANSSHNKVFIKFLESIIGLLAARGARIEEYNHFNEWEVKSHREIFEAIKARDAARAREIMNQHLDNSARAYLEMNEEDGIKGGNNNNGS